jgi:hypothetical protein
MRGRRLNLDLDGVVGRATLAANRARVLPDWWVALPVQGWGRRYVVILDRAPDHRVAAVYRVRPDLRLKRITRWPWPLWLLAREALATTPIATVEHPGNRAGQVMTNARLRRSRW